MTARQRPFLAPPPLYNNLPPPPQRQPTKRPTRHEEKKSNSYTEYTSFYANLSAILYVELTCPPILPLTITFPVRASSAPPRTDISFDMVSDQRTAPLARPHTLATRLQRHPSHDGRPVSNPQCSSSLETLACKRLCGECEKTSIHGI